MDASQLQAGHLAGATAFNSGNEHAHDNPLFLWHQLQQSPQFSEYFRQIQALLAASDQLWSMIHILRTDAEAPALLEALHLSTIYLIPPSDIWDLLVGLRSHRSWPTVRSTVLSQIGKPRHQSYSTASSRSSALSSRSYAGLSFGSGRAPSSIPSSYGGIGTVDEAEEEGKQSRSSQHDIRGTNVATTISGKASKKAPEGTKFVCPHTQCRGKYAFKRLGDWVNHVIKYHQGAPDANPYDYLQRDLDVSPQTPVIGDKAELPTFSTFRSSGNTHPQISTVNDLPATGPEYHLPMHQLTDNTLSMMAQTGYWRKTGIYPIQIDTGVSHSNSIDESKKDVSYFIDDDDMDDKEW